jgi:hypothetical protein
MAVPCHPLLYGSLRLGKFPDPSGRNALKVVGLGDVEVDLRPGPFKRTRLWSLRAVGLGIIIDVELGASTISNLRKSLRQLEKSNLPRIKARSCFQKEEKKTNTTRRWILLRKLRNTSRLCLLQSLSELLPDVLLQKLAFGIADPVWNPELLDLTTRQKLSMTLITSNQTVKNGATSLLRSSGHHSLDPAVHNLGEGSCLLAQASRAETRSN